MSGRAVTGAMILGSCSNSRSTAKRSASTARSTSRGCSSGSGSPARRSRSSATARSSRAAGTRPRRLAAATGSGSWSPSAEAEPPMNAPTQPLADPLVTSCKAYASLLLIGTGKYRDFDETRRAVEASGAEIVTVAIRRTNIGQNAHEPSLLDAVPPSKYTYLPNTAGCYTADDAVQTLRLARELLDGHDLVKLEVLGDAHTLFPNVIETLAAAATLVKDGFKVMVYTSDDPIIAKQLEEIGCVAVMPLASLIGSGMGILNPWNLQIIIENAKAPVIVDAGVGTASDAAIAMELGCDGVLMNTAVAAAKDPVLMASAMKKAVEAGRAAFRAGRMPKKLYSGSPSSPTSGISPSSK